MLGKPFASYQREVPSATLISPSCFKKKSLDIASRNWKRALGHFFYVNTANVCTLWNNEAIHGQHKTKVKGNTNIKTGNITA